MASVAVPVASKYPCPHTRSRAQGRPVETSMVDGCDPQGTKTLHVSLSGSHTAPFSSWATAATNIQAAVDAASDGDTVLVTNGTYQTGGCTTPSQPLLTNRLVIGKPISVRSLNGPALTVLKGAGPVGNAAVRCAYVAQGATLSGFTLTNGATRAAVGGRPDEEGGGVWIEPGGLVADCVVSGNKAGANGGGANGGSLRNCKLSGNSTHYGGGASDATLIHCTVAGNWALDCGGGVSGCTLKDCALIGNAAGGLGGGAFGGTLSNCTLSGNVVRDSGGGVWYATLDNCTLSGNVAQRRGGGTAYGKLDNCTVSGNAAYESGGGVCGGDLSNCIVYFNLATKEDNYEGGTFEYSCTTPLPDGAGNVSADPQFIDAALGDYHLKSSSPCRGTGNNANALGGAEREGTARASHATVDMGANVNGAGVGTRATSPKEPRGEARSRGP